VRQQFSGNVFATRICTNDTDTLRAEEWERGITRKSNVWRVVPYSTNLSRKFDGIFPRKVVRVKDGHALCTQTTFWFIICHRVPISLLALTLNLLLRKTGSCKRRVKRNRTSTGGHNHRVHVDAELFSRPSAQPGYPPLSRAHMLNQRDTMSIQNGGACCLAHVTEDLFGKRVPFGVISASQTLSAQRHV
jgi:hypothetical protein